MMRRGDRGFTLVEVMLALAILFGALVMLIGKTASNIQAAQKARMLGVTTDLARGKMFDIEEELLREGFQDTDQEEDGDFSDEGWPKVAWEVKVEKVDLPDLNTLDQLQGQDGKAEGDGASGGAAPGGAFGGMLGLGGGSTDASGAAGASLISSQFEMFRNVLEATIRKVTLTVKWKVGGDDESMEVIAYFTDPAAVQKAMMGLPTGAASIPGADGTGTGTGTGGTTGGTTGGGTRTGGRTR